MAAYSEITIEQYANFSTTINVDDIQGDALNLTNYLAASQIRKSYYSTTSTSFNVAISNASSGELTISMNSDVTSNLTPGRYLYDVVITAPNTNNKTRIVEGIAVVLPGVTR